MSDSTRFDFREFMDLEMMLMGLKAEEIASTAVCIMRTELIRHKAGIAQLARALHLAITYRPQCLDHYVELLKQERLKCVFDPLRNELLNVIFHCFHTSWAYPCECGSLVFLYRAHQSHVYSDSEVCSEIKSFFLHPKVMYLQRLWIWAYFAPLLSRFDPEMETQMLQIYSERREILLSRPEFGSFYDRYQEVKQGQWKEHSKWVNREDTFEHILKNDNIDELKRISGFPEFDFDQPIEPSLFEPCWFLRDRPRLIQYAIYHNAEKCVQFMQRFADLSVVDGKGKTTAQFAAAGGSTEMMAMCQQWSCSLAGTLQIAAGYFQSDIFFWLRDTQLGEDDGQYGEIMLSAAASANVSIVSYCLEHGVGVNWKDASGNTALHYACYVGQIETVAFLLSVKDVDVNCMTVCHLFMTNKFLRLCLLLNTDILLLRKCLFQGLSSGSMNAMLLVFDL